MGTDFRWCYGPGLGHGPMSAATVRPDCPAQLRPVPEAQLTICRPVLTAEG